MQTSELGLANAVTEATSKAVAAAPFPVGALKGAMVIYCAGCMLEVNRGGKMPKVTDPLDHCPNPNPIWMNIQGGGAA